MKQNLKKMIDGRNETYLAQHDRYAYLGVMTRLQFCQKVIDEGWQFEMDKQDPFPWDRHKYERMDQKYRKLYEKRFEQKKDVPVVYIPEFGPRPISLIEYKYLKEHGGKSVKKKVYAEPKTKEKIAPLNGFPKTIF